MKGGRSKNFFVIGAVIGIVIGVAGGMLHSRQTKAALGQEKDPLMPYVFADEKIDAVKFEQFFDHLSEERMNLVMKSMKKDFPGTADKGAVKKELVWESSHWTTYPFKNKKYVEYHDTVQWVARKMKISKEKIENCSTFQLERMIYEKAFMNTWDQLTEEQRLKVLQEFDTEKKISDKAGIAALGGASALGALSTTIVVSGFAFYTTTSSLLASAAGIFSLTVPFKAYLGASSAISLFGGPVGWTIVGISAITGASLLGTADTAQTARAIIQIHLLKVEAIQNSGVDIAQYLEQSSS